MLIFLNVWWEITSHSDYVSINFHVCISHSMMQCHGVCVFCNLSMNKHGFLMECIANVTLLLKKFEVFYLCLLEIAYMSAVLFLSSY